MGCAGGHPPSVPQPDAAPHGDAAAVDGGTDLDGGVDGSISLDGGLLDGSLFDSGTTDSGTGRCNGSGLSQSALPEDLRVDAMDMAAAMSVCEWGRRLGRGHCGSTNVFVMTHCEADVLLTGTVPCDVTVCEVEACIFDRVTMDLTAGVDGTCSPPNCEAWDECAARAVAALRP